MKKKLLEMFNKKQERKEELKKRSQQSEDVTELRSINNELDTLNLEMEELRSMIDALPDENGENNNNNDNNEHFVPGGENRSANQGGFNAIASYTNIGGTTRRSTGEDEDIYSTLEYRQAFRNYVVEGTPMPTEFISKRSNELTVTSDLGAVIPTNILNKVIEDITIEGKVLGRITQTSMQGGVEIPISDINPTATWLESETTVSDEQKAEMKAKVKFGYHVLEAKVAIGLLASTVSLSLFETTVVKQLKKAMIRALETAIVSGTGTGQPKGITKYDLPKEQIIKMDSKTIGTVAAWSTVEASVPESAEDAVIYMMNKATWEKYLNGMTDTTGQKIGLGKINEKGQKILNGREVLTCDKFPSFDACEEGGTFGVLVDLSQYMLNSNLAMYFKKYFNEDTNKWIHKALMIADGQMAIGEVEDSKKKKKLVGANGLLYLQKTANVGA
ncbi:phage major capsid protein [[Clostridium] sordellii]|uniref:phage major capsid protein n=1 Tax=Paraclostridium sordellii TaxID=1505 RepID=UPI0005DF63C5|nr:phage major capsid protein [Paeniclostridium sordellii]CEP42275.1 phage major capsid protein [[Clostridium] sordellii] [Paeniclostridium sordellii]